MGVEIKGLHRAIKELRAELDRVTLAIQRIETIAEAMSREQQAGGSSSGRKPRTIKPGRDGSK
jgi:hypothetical protein